MLIAAFGGQADIPDLGRALAEFDEWLHAEPAVLTEADAEKAELRRVLGLAS